MTIETDHKRIVTDFDKHETDLFVTDSNENGPTVLVVGGVHGGEPAGSRAAQQFANAIPGVGTLAAIPRANPNGLRHRSRGNGPWIDDLNDCFPADDDTSDLKAHPREIWKVIEDVDPDIFFDLHTSRWPRTMDKSASVGQAIYPSPDCRDKASRVCERVSNEYIRHGDNLLSDEWQNRRSRYYFTVGNSQGNPGDVALVDRVDNKLGASSFLVETARNGLSMEARKSWLTAIVLEMCEEFNVPLYGV